ncbi:hypothetical protein FDF74_11590 [Clostridium niameyense]|uniref:Uncharacterized protein n=1 Tax=Clostridium niameyense TaxID=1622073 RepID=A0A6M0RC59_9CLOT|nr:hypothetical protein [Clostridium niameyense]NEZ47824.1 hypothetical protein [Clostridium niameyense]
MNKKVEIEVCLNLLKKYNDNSKSKFDLVKSKKNLEGMSLDQILKTEEGIKELIIGQETNLFLNNLVSEIERHGADFVKVKYGLAI